MFGGKALFARTVLVTVGGIVSVLAQRQKEKELVASCAPDIDENGTPLVPAAVDLSAEPAT
jgi:hypothetical protein